LTAYRNSSTAYRNSSTSYSTAPSPTTFNVWFSHNTCVTDKQAYKRQGST